MTVRWYEVDSIKAIGILTVVLIHSLRPYWQADVSTAELWLHSATRFAVPGFVLASGFLYSTREPIAWRVTYARLRRLLVPYLIASLAAQLYSVGFEGKSISASTLLHDLLLASSFGPFYYVFVALFLVLLAPGFARLSGPALVWVSAAVLVAQWLSWSIPGLLFWVTRNPLYWLGFFLAGWWLKRTHAVTLPWLASARLPVCALALAVATGAAMLEELAAPRWLSGLPAWLKVASILTGLVAWAAERKGASGSARFLSDRTYTMYLFHLFFVYPVLQLLPPAPRAFDPIALGCTWLAGVVGPLLLVAASQRLLGGPRSRALLGS
jgi:fucose 4-O-acetylase-like acetyltransferase